MNPYYIYVTLHLMECAWPSFAQEACDIKWDIASEVYGKFLHSEYDIPDASEYDCIEEFLSHHDEQSILK